MDPGQHRSDLQDALEDVLELLEELPDDERLGVARPELEQVLSRLWLHGAAWGEELTLERLHTLYSLRPTVALTVLEGRDPEKLARELLMRDGREQHRARRRAAS